MTSGVARCLLAAALFGASTPALKRLLGGTSPLTTAGLLYLGAALAVLPLLRRGAARQRSRRDVRRLAGAVALGGAVAPVLYLFALRLAPSASVSLWLNLEAVMTSVLAWALFHENLDRRGWIAVALVFGAGAVLAAPSGLQVSAAALLVAGACLCWGVDNNLTALIGGFTPAQSTFAKGLFAGLLNLGLGLALEGNAPGIRYLLAALGIGALGYGASLFLYISGAQQLGAARSQLLFATGPFGGMALAWAWLGEPALPLQVAAAAAMAFALWLLLGSRHAHPHTHSAMSHTHSHRHDDGHHDHVHPGLPAWLRHTHEHAHEPLTHTHAHWPDLHHRHEH